VTSFEQIVRPFARPNTLARRRIIASSTKIDVPEAILSWGSAGTLPGATEIEQIDPTGTNFNVITCKENYDEVDRRSRPVRIEQQDNAENYVVFNRIDQVSFLKRDKKKDRQVTYSINTAVDPETGTIYRVLRNDQEACKQKYLFDHDSA
jgi:hypothetical protein